MPRKMKWTKALLIAMLLLVPFAALAGVSIDAYRQLPKTFPAGESLPTEQITGATAADALTFDTPIANRAQAAKSNQTVVCEVDFSGAAADTVVVYFVPYHIDASSVVSRLPGLQVVTATAGPGTDAALDNIAPAIFFEVPAGCTHYEIRHGLPSAGNVDLFWIAYSVDPE